VSESERSVYLVLGAAGSGRREIVADLINAGLDETDHPGVLTLASEPGTPPGSVAAATWEWEGEGALNAAWPEGVDTLFFIGDGRGNPVDLVEAIKPWLASQGASLVRVISVVHCTLLEQNAALVAWYDACIHFSDIVLLNRRENVANKWIFDYRARFAKNYLPCLVEMVKKDRVSNPALVLDPQVRRLSHWFDDGDDDGGWQSFVDSAEDVIIEDETEPEDTADDLEPEDEYLARNLGGTRRKVIPDIAKHLPVES
jgi:hypothetical protein